MKRSQVRTTIRNLSWILREHPEFKHRHIKKFVLNGIDPDKSLFVELQAIVAAEKTESVPKE